MTWSLKISQENHWTVGIGLLLISTIIHFLALNQTPYANGWDGYYYVMQAHSFIEYGYLQSLDYSLIYPYFIFISYIISDYELAFKIGTAILSGVLTFVTFKVIYAYSSNIYLAVLGACITIFSPGITFFISQFPKNLLGLIFLIPLAYYLTQKKYLLAILFIVLSLLTHRLTGALGILFFLTAVLKSVSWKYMIGIVIIIILTSLLPGILHYSDLERFYGELSYNLQFSPISFIHLGLTQQSLVWTLEIVVGSMLLILFSFWVIKRLIEYKTVSQEGLMLLLLLLLLFFPFFVIEHGSMGYRFFILIPFITPFLITAVLRNINRHILSILSIIFIASSAFSYSAYNPNVHDAPNKMYMKIASMLHENYSSDRYPLVIAHKSLAEVIIYKTDFDALNWAVPNNFEKEKVLRIVHRVPQILLNQYTTHEERSSQVERVNINYCIMPELLWQSILLKAGNDKHFMKQVRDGNNPLKPRPGYLLKGKDL